MKKVSREMIVFAGISENRINRQTTPKSLIVFLVVRIPAPDAMMPVPSQNSPMLSGG